MRTTTKCVVPILLGFLAACGGNSDGTNEDGATLTSVQPNVAPASADVPDACTFIPRAELERMVGRELSQGEAGDVGADASRCDFETPAQLYVTRRYDNPPLPEASGFDSITITTNRATPASFTEFRDGLADNAEEVSSIGDGAYFYGPAMIYVRVGYRGFSIRLHVNEPETDAGRARLRAVMLSLAESGASRLQ